MRVLLRNWRPYPNRNTAKPIAMTQVMSVKTTLQKQPGRAVADNHLSALIPAIWGACQGVYTHDLACSLRTRHGARPRARFPGSACGTSPSSECCLVSAWTPQRQGALDAARGCARRACDGGQGRLARPVGLASNAEPAREAHR